MFKAILAPLLLLSIPLFAQETKGQKPKESVDFFDEIKQKEAQAAVPRETVPIEESKFLIDTPIPKTAHYLPFLQTLLSIKPGTLPNPIGVSIIGGFTQEQYKIKKFRAKLGSGLTSIGTKLGSQLDTLLTKLQANNSGIMGTLVSDATLFGGKLNKQQGLLWQGKPNNDAKTNRQDFFNNLSTLDSALPVGLDEWTIQDGMVKTSTSAVGVKADLWLLPFMQIFAGITYLHMEQETNIGTIAIPLQQPIKVQDYITGTLGNSLANAQPISTIPVPVGNLMGPIRNVLDGYAALGGTNLAIGYKGFFASFMIAGGYVQLDDLQNNVKGFVEKPFMYLAPRMGYSFGGMMTAHFGVQYVELFGATEGKDLSAVTGGLVSNYAVELEKFPVNFLIGTSFTPIRDFGISLECVISPDVRGLNAELAYRF